MAPISCKVGRPERWRLVALCDKLAKNLLHGEETEAIDEKASSGAFGKSCGAAIQSDSRRFTKQT
jgi:hypothetical protein